MGFKARFGTNEGKPKVSHTLSFCVAILAIVAISGCKTDGDDADRITAQPAAEIPGGVIPTPEPGTTALFVLGAGALWASTKQRPWR